MKVMNNDELDKLFRDKASNSSQTFKGGTDWDTFYKLLSQSEGFENLEFDKKIKSRVSSHQAKFNQNHWELLKLRLIKEEKLKKKVFITTVIESAAVVMLLFLFQQFDYRFSQQKNQWLKDTQYVGKNDQKQTKNNNSSKLNGVEDVLIYSHHAYNFSETSVIEELEPSAQENNVNVQDIAVSDKPIDKGLNLFSINTLSNEINKLWQNNVLDPKFMSRNVVQVEPKPQESVLATVSETQGSLMSIASDDAEHSSSRVQEIFNIESLLSAPSKEVNSLVNSRQELNVSVPSSIKYKETEAMHFIQPTIGFGQSIIKSSYDKIYNLKAYTTYSSQINIGAFYSYKKNNLELQSGLRYMEREYNPQKVSEYYSDIFDNPFRISLDKISYNMIEVPLHFKLFLKQSPVVNFYAKMGASINLTLKSKYNLDENSLVYSSFAKPSITSTFDGEIIDNKAKLSKKDFTPGILQKGGSFEDNTFITVGGELGMERRIYKNTFFVLSTEYNQYFMIEGIGPNEDKFNMLNINLGIKYRLK